MDTTEQEKENTRVIKELQELNDKIYKLVDYHSDKGLHNAQRYLTTASDSIEELIRVYEIGLY